MSTNHSASKSSKSIVGSVASHEKELLAKLEASRVEAREIVDQARADARQFLADADAKLTEEMSALRRQREASRQAEFDKTVAEADARLAGVRDSANAQVDAMTQEVLALFLPKGGN